MRGEKPRPEKGRAPGVGVPGAGGEEVRKSGDREHGEFRRRFSGLPGMAPAEIPPGPHGPAGEPARCAIVSATRTPADRFPDCTIYQNQRHMQEDNSKRATRLQRSNNTLVLNTNTGCRPSLLCNPGPHSPGPPGPSPGRQARRQPAQLEPSQPGRTGRFFRARKSQLSPTTW